MKKKDKIEIISPFNNLVGNWQLIEKLQSFLNTSLQENHLFTNVKPNEQQEKLMKTGIQQLLKLCKTLMLMLENLKNEQKNIQRINQNALIAQDKIQQHEEVIKNFERKFSERTKALVQQNKIMKDNNEKMKRIINEHDDILKQVRQKFQQQIRKISAQKERAQSQSKRLLEHISKLQKQLQFQQDTNQILKSTIETEQDSVALDSKIAFLSNKKKVNAAKKQKPFDSCLQKIALTDLSAFSRLIEFLNPKEVCNLTLLNRTIRLCLLKSKSCQISVYKSIKAVKNKKIEFYHRHINYFQAHYQKIPEEILQHTYYRYYILKQIVGGQILNILNSSAIIFEGKFTDENENQFYLGFNSQNISKVNQVNRESWYLDVDQEIINDYLEQKKQQKQKLIKQFETMFKKINNTFQLYSADVESSTLFIQNLMKHFSKNFVLSKNLYIQAQNLQKLNTFILSELCKWDKMQIDKNSQLEDLRAQMQAQRKLKHYFTDKSIKSQQKALLQQNLKLNYQLKYNKLSDMMNIVCQQKEDSIKKNLELINVNRNLANENKELRRVFQNCKQKYNKLVEELTLVKETIVRMNII